ncbi:hypothetical protein SLEP1_g20083 [Rubroshorea leprosula]|uniref:Uncharacterized protein n=1 Tax=Rubroshorea leprosula TaxID=152421 RepID=A0AAV5J7I7_9ROSI|nr:hypothetical protein SLEP1_g20083 [Rubroshorea leprosula]
MYFCRAGSSCQWELLNTGISWVVITLAVTYRGDVYFVPVLVSVFLIALVGML